MRLSQQLVLFTLAAVVLPLSAVGFFTLRRAERELSARLLAEQRAVASAAAERTAGLLLGAVDSVSASARLVDWSHASPEERRGALQLLAAQSELIAAVALVEGDAVVAQVEGGDGHPQFRGPDGLLAGVLPVAALGPRGNPGQVATGSAVNVQGAALLPVAIQVGPPAERTPFVVLLLGLEGAVQRLQRAGPFSLVDGEGRLLAGQGAPFSPAAPQWRERLGSGVRAGQLASGAFLASAELPEHLGLFAVVERPAAEVEGPVTALRDSALLGVGLSLGLLALAGAALAARITRRLSALSATAEAFGRGELGTRLEAGGGDELGSLAGTFNAMGQELQGARARLERWNDELKARVEAATAELKAAQAQLLEAQKLAAIGQLGAGVAHEINNPLVGILGNAQLLLLDHGQGDPDFEVLKAIEEGAKRCRDVNASLLRFSQSQGQAQLRPTDLGAVVRGVLQVEQARCDDEQVRVVQAVPAEPLLANADPDQLAQVVGQLCLNARTAMRGRPTRVLTVEVARTGAELAVTVSDTGKGIAPEHLARVFEPFFTTKDEWSNLGLGLSVAYRVAQEHGGRLEARSPPGEGASFTLRLPTLEAAKRPAPPAASPPVPLGGRGSGVLG